MFPEMVPAPSRPGYAVFAAMLAAAGLPIYIHAPKVYVDEFGVGLTALAGVLFALRLFDVVQDPVLGWLAQRLRGARALAVAGGVAVLAASMFGLFAVTPPIAPIWWFALMMTGALLGLLILDHLHVCPRGRRRPTAWPARLSAAGRMARDGRAPRRLCCRRRTDGFGCDRQPLRQFRAGLCRALRAGALADAP